MLPIELFAGPCEEEWFSISFDGYIPHYLKYPQYFCHNLNNFNIYIISLFIQNSSKTDKRLSLYSNLMYIPIIESLWVQYTESPL